MQNQEQFVMPTADADEQQGRFHILGFLWQRKWIIACGPILALGLGYLYYSRQPAVYESSAQVLLIHQRADLPVDKIETSDYVEEVDTQLLLIRSPAVLKRAVDEHALAKLPGMAGNTVGKLTGGLSVSGSGGRTESQVITFRFRGEDPDV